VISAELLEIWMELFSEQVLFINKEAGSS